MPTFELTSPEGKKYRVTGPEGSTEQDALKQLQTKLGSLGMDKPSASFGQSALDVVKQIPSGIARGIETAPSIGPRLMELGGELLQKPLEAIGMASPEAERERQAFKAKNKPFMATSALPEPETKAGQYVSSIGEFTPLMAAGAGKLAGGLLERLAKRFAPGVTAGAGAQAGQDIGGTPGAIIGGIAGGMAPAGIEAGASAARRALRPPEEQALGRVGAMASRPGPGLRPEEMPTTPGSMIADVGQAGKLVRPTANVSPEGRDLLTASINDRFAGQGDRMGGTLRNLVAGGADPYATKIKIQEKYDAQRGGAYTKAYEAGDKPVWSPELERLTAAPTVNDAMKGAIAKWRDWQVNDGFGAANPPLKVTPDGRLEFTGSRGQPVYPNLQLWDYTARNIADAARSARQAGKTAEAARLGGLERQLKAELDKIVPDFKNARGVAVEFFGGRDAIDAGSKAVNFKGDIREFRDNIAKLRPGEKEAFQEAYLDALARKVEQVPERHDATNRLFQNKLERQKVEALVGKEGVARTEAMLRIENVFNLARKALGNSTTAQQFVELGLAGGAGVEEYIRTGGDLSHAGSVAGAGFLALKYGGAGLRRAQAFVDGKTAKEVARLLVSDDPADLKRAIDMAAKNQNLRTGLERLGEMLATGGRGGRGGAIAASPPLSPREIVRQDAKEALREKKQKNYSSDDIKTLRQAASGKADSTVLMKARRIMEGPEPTKITVRPGDAPSYGGPL